MFLTPPSSWPRMLRLSSLVFNYPWMAPTNSPAHNPRRTKLNICDTFKANFNLSAKPNLWFVYLVTNVRKKIKAVWYTKQLNLHKVHLKFFFTAYQRLHPIRRKQTAQVQRNILFFFTVVHYENIMLQVDVEEGQAWVGPPPPARPSKFPVRITRQLCNFRSFGPEV